jgi:hypothetical protein
LLRSRYGLGLWYVEFGFFSSVYLTDLYLTVATFDYQGCYGQAGSANIRIATLFYQLYAVAGLNTEDWHSSMCGRDQSQLQLAV